MAACRAGMIFLAVVLFALGNALMPEKGSTWIESKLYDDVMAGYSKHVAPSFNGGPVEVQLDPTLEAILAVNERRETIEFVQWWLIWWTDNHLQWDPKEYNGTRYLYMHAHELWQPDVTMFELIEKERPIPHEHMVVRAAYDGWVRMATTEKIKAKCVMQLRDFPFDKHTCTFRYLSWMYPSTKLTLMNYGDFDKSREADKNQEWKISNLSVNVEVENYGVGVWYIAYYHITFERRPHFFLFIHFVPIALVTALVIMGLFTPYQSGLIRFQKVGIGLSGLVAHCVLLLRVVDSLPKTDVGIPYLGRYMICEIVLCCVATVIATLIVEVNSLAKLGYRVPKCCARLCKLRKHGGYRDVNEHGEKPMGAYNKIVTTTSTDNDMASRKLDDLCADAIHVMHELSARIEQLGASVARGESKIADPWSIICFRLDIVLFVAFEVANIVISLSFAAGP